MPLLAALGVDADDAVALPWGLFWDLAEAADRDRIKQARLMLTTNGMAFGSYPKQASQEVLRSWDDFLAPPSDETGQGKGQMSIDQFTNTLAAMMGARF